MLLIINVWLVMFALINLDVFVNNTRPFPFDEFPRGPVAPLTHVERIQLFVYLSIVSHNRSLRGCHLSHSPLHCGLIFLQC